LGSILFQEPIKEAGILEGRNSIKETCLQVIQVGIVLMSFDAATLHGTIL